LIFTRRILEFYFDFLMRRAVLLLPALLCAKRKLKFCSPNSDASRRTPIYTASKPHFANGAKFTAHKFRFSQTTGKFRPLQVIAKFRLSQAAPNFKI